MAWEIKRSLLLHATPLRHDLSFTKSGIWVWYRLDSKSLLVNVYWWHGLTDLGGIHIHQYHHFGRLLTEGVGLCAFRGWPMGPASGVCCNWKTWDMWCMLYMDDLRLWTLCMIHADPCNLVCNSIPEMRYFCICPYFITYLTNIGRDWLVVQIPTLILLIVGVWKC